MTFFMQLELFHIQETTLRKSNKRKLITRKLNKRKKGIKLNKFSPRKLNILYGIIIIISYFLKVLLCPRLN